MSNKLKAVLIDDERKLREVLKIKLENYCPQIDIIGEANNAHTAYDKITELEPDIIFLDIQMPGESGFELLKRFDKINFEIIFVTGFNEYALQALKLSAVDYILKPISTEDLKNAVNKALERVNHKLEIRRYEILKHNVQFGEDKRAKIVIPSSSYYQFVEVDDIIHCEGWQKYTKIHLKNDEVVISSYNIGVFRDILAPYSFYSPHKSHLINTNKIDKYLKGGIIVLSNGDEIPVSRRRKEAFLKELRQLGILHK